MPCAPVRHTAYLLFVVRCYFTSARVRRQMPTASGATTHRATEAPSLGPLLTGQRATEERLHRLVHVEPRGGVLEPGHHRAEDRPRGRQDEEDDDRGRRVLEEHAEADALGDAEQHVAAGAEEHEGVRRPVAGDAAEGDRGLVREGGEDEGQREGADADEERRQEPGPGDADAARLETEGDEAGALAPLGRDGEDADDREDERHRHRRGLEVLAEGVLAALVEEHDRQGDGDDRPDADEEPAAGPGVEHLAQARRG